jgi:RNA polymerase sigma-70 factor (ECF subfamily)
MRQKVGSIDTVNGGNEATQTSDSVLMSRLQNGDSSAMNELVRRFGPSLKSLVSRLTNWSAESDDILQEVFLTAWQKAAAFQGTGSLEGWLRRLAVNRCHNHHRARAAFKRMLDRVTLRTETSTADRLSKDDSDSGELRIALAKLGRADRAVLVLYYLEELSGEQVADAMDVRIETVHVRLHRARRRLREILDTESSSNGKR